MPNESLEPKVAALEVAVDSVTKDLASLTGIVRELAQGVQKQWQQTENQFAQVLVAVERAAAPRKTDWHLLLGAVGLIMAVGAAAFSPLMLRVSDVQIQTLRDEANFKAHTELPMHPVGLARVDGLEAALREKNERNAKDIEALDAKLQREYLLIDAAIREKVSGLETSIKALDTKHNEETLRLDSRLQTEFTKAQADLEHKTDEIIERLHAVVPDLQVKVAVLETKEALRNSAPPPPPPPHGRPR